MLSAKKILVISIYPILNAQHGGQKRVKAFVDFYRTLYKEVRHVSVFHQPDYPEFDNQIDFPVSDKKLITEIKNQPLFADYIIGRALYEDEAVRTRLTSFIDEYGPDVIEFEQSFPFAGLKHVLEQSNYQGKLVFNSQNIEGRMKRHILKELGEDSVRSEDYLKKIEQDERIASRKADLVLASSSTDAKLHKKFGANRVVYARNGIEKIVPTKAAIEHWKKFKQDNDIEKLVTYVGSAHPPNLTGFKKMIGFDLGFLAPKAQFMIAGGVSQYMQGYISEHDEYSTFWNRASPLGRVSDDNLAGLIAVSDLIVLPITTGGGSNLKTAEAIASGKRIVGTSFAFRSFDEYAGLKRVFISDNPSLYKKKINEYLEQPSLRLSPRQRNLASKVYWHELLDQKRFTIELALASNKPAVATFYLAGRAKSYIKKITKRFLKKLFRNDR